jgi:hypothetical protein
MDACYTHGYGLNDFWGYQMVPSVVHVGGLYLVSCVGDKRYAMRIYLMQRVCPEG